MNIGIFSGSFNPIHIGHLILANYITEFTDMDEIWFLVTPQNPLKENTNLLDEQLRLEMVEKGLIDYPKLKASDFEFSLPRPSYTINTLDALSEQYPEHNFSLIIGADNWVVFDRWKDSENIIKKYKVYVYPRLDCRISIPKKFKNRVEALESPILEISSTFIRDSIRNGKNIKVFLPDSVYKYIKKNNLYK